MTAQSQPKTVSKLVNKASMQALSGGIAGMIAQSFNVLTMMWIHTVMTFQYRYSGGFIDVVKKLYAEGGIPRFYRGLVPAMFQSPIARFRDIAANEGTMAALEHSKMPIWIKTMSASMSAACFRVVLMPIDAWKTNNQVDGKKGGLRRLIERTKRNPTVPFRGAAGAMSATWIGHYTWFYTNNQLSASTPKLDSTYGKYARNAAIGFISSVVSDSCTNSLRVLKTVRQTALEPISYRDAAATIVEQEGYAGLFGRGLQTRIIANGIQGAIFTVGWKAFQEILEKRYK